MVYLNELLNLGTFDYTGNQVFYDHENFPTMPEPSREGTFLIGGGGGNSFFGKKKLLHVASILYIQAKLPVEINLNYFTGVEKFTYQKAISLSYLLPSNIIVSLDPCPLSPIF